MFKHFYPFSITLHHFQHSNISDTPSLISLCLCPFHPCHIPFTFFICPIVFFRLHDVSASISCPAFHIQQTFVTMTFCNHSIFYILYPVPSVTCSFLCSIFSPLCHLLISMFHVPCSNYMSPCYIYICTTLPSVYDSLPSLSRLNNLKFHLL